MSTRASEPGSRNRALFAEGAGKSFVCRFLEKSRRLIHHSSPYRARRAPHYAEQVGDDPEQAEDQIERCVSRGVLAGARAHRRAVGVELRWRDGRPAGRAAESASLPPIVSFYCRHPNSFLGRLHFLAVQTSRHVLSRKQRGVRRVHLLDAGLQPIRPRSRVLSHPLRQVAMPDPH